MLQSGGEVAIISLTQYLREYIEEEASALLISSFGHSVDAKGRVFIPAKWRDDLGDTVIITRDMMGNADSRCLYGMPVELWNDILERFKKVAVSDVKAQNAMRRLFAKHANVSWTSRDAYLSQTPSGSTPV